MDKPIDFKKALKKLTEREDAERESLEVERKKELERVNFFYNMNYKELVEFDYTKLKAPEWECFIKAMLNHLFDFVDLVPAMSTDIHNVAKHVDEVVEELYDNMKRVTTATDERMDELHINMHKMAVATDERMDELLENLDRQQGELYEMNEVIKRQSTLIEKLEKELNK